MQSRKKSSNQESLKQLNSLLRGVKKIYWEKAIEIHQKIALEEANGVKNYQHALKMSIQT